MERIGFGVLSYDMAHTLGGLVLMMSLALLAEKRITSVINTYALQAIILSAAAAWQGYAQHAPHLFVTAVITLAVKGLAIPVAMHRIVRRLDIRHAVESALGIFPTMALGVSLVTLSILVVLPTTIQAQALTREDLVLALSVVLLGLLMMITRRTALTQVIGFMSLENGLILAAVGVAGMPLVVELSVAVLVMVAFVVFGVFFFRIRAQFDSLDLGHLEAVGSAHR